MVQSARSRRSPQARAERADRILDAAADLMVVLGPAKITIEDVARRAGVGKGTVYLHFPTKEVLFLVVLMRTQAETAARIVRVMGEDPVQILPSRVGATSLEAFGDSPLLQKVFMADTGMLGTVSETAAAEGGEVTDQRLNDLEAYFHLLREHGLVRTDLAREELFHIFGTTITGFLMYPPLLESQGRNVPTRERRTQLAADALSRSLGETDDPEALSTAWPQVVGLFDNTVQRVRAEIDRYRNVRRE
ncbi:helix-turn-helix transcriptional regulator [Nocardiopsis sp. HNM0947]|uniref:Helix-turn-helix transcriptional regulator n=1 Tax=Nocardiopsis coralli TaxID=2772213 RepID=A0ABR9PC75_9ACTN|nr:helix-turn-helix domain-containing protein [Nocardiopsis coralli]MBE3001431.1 helix-turn-helix transcriptional regulator [Nocardiopsis coralli]